MLRLCKFLFQPNRENGRILAKPKWPSRICKYFRSRARLFTTVAGRLRLESAAICRF